MNKNKFIFILKYHLLGMCILMLSACSKFEEEWQPYVGTWSNTQLLEKGEGYSYIELSDKARYKYQLIAKNGRSISVSGRYKVKEYELNFVTMDIYWRGDTRDTQKPLIITRKPYVDSLGNIHISLNDIDYVRE